MRKRRRGIRAREFTDAGLLNGLTGEPRAARIAVLQRLADHGTSVEELRRATIDGHLPHLLLEDALTPHGAGRTLRETAKLAEASESDVERWFRAIGRGVSGIDDYSDDDVELAKLLAHYRELGLDENAMFANARIIGRNLWAVADGAESLFETQISLLGTSRPEEALRFAEEVERIAEFQSRILSRIISSSLHRRITATTKPEGSPHSGDITVCFIDLVGFTALGEQIEPLELSRIVAKLDLLTTEHVDQPVRFVKMVGDAVMLISPDPTALCATVLGLTAAAESAGLPPLHAGIAFGNAVPTAGDWIGPAVNLASRIAAVAEAEVVLIDEDVHRRLAPQTIARDPIGPRALKGYGNPRHLYRLRAT